MDKKYSITVNHKQLRVIERALDAYLRLGIGQLEEIANILEEHDLLSIGKRRDAVKDWTNPMKLALLGLKSGESVGICNEKTSEKAKIAYDIDKAVQQGIAIEEDHDQYSVWRDGDSLHISKEPKVSIVKLTCDSCPETCGTDKPEDCKIIKEG